MSDISPTQADTQAEPLHVLHTHSPGPSTLITTSEAADLMGKTYRQFTAYASHHQLPQIPADDGTPRYERGLILKRAAEAASRRSHSQPRPQPLEKAEQADPLPSPSALVRYAQQITDLAQVNQRLALKNDDLHERLLAAEADKAKAVREAENRLRAELAEAERRIADLQTANALAQQRAEAEKQRREKAEAAEKAAQGVSVWQKLFGRG